MTNPYPPQPPGDQPGVPPANPFGPVGQPDPHAPAPNSPFNGPAGPGGPVLPPPTGLEPPGMPPQPPPKKSKTGVIIGVVILVLVLAGAGVGVYLWAPWKSSGSDSTMEPGGDQAGEEDGDSQKSSPSDVVEEAWFAPDWETAKGFMCADYAKQLEDNGSAEDYRPPPEDEKLEIVDETVEEESAEVVVNTLVAGEEGDTDADVQVDLEVEDGQWRICQISPVE